MAKKTPTPPEPRGKKIGIIAALLRGLREKKRPWYKFDGDGRR